MKSLMLRSYLGSAVILALVFSENIKADPHCTPQPVSCPKTKDINIIYSFANESMAMGYSYNANALIKETGDWFSPETFDENQPPFKNLSMTIGWDKGVPGYRLTCSYSFNNKNSPDLLLETHINASKCTGSDHDKSPVTCCLD